MWYKEYGDAGDETPKDIEMVDDGSLVLLADRSDGDIVVYRVSSENGSDVKPYFVTGTNSQEHANTITPSLDGFIITGYADSTLVATGAKFKTAFVFRYDKEMVQILSWDYRLSLYSGNGGYDFVPIKVFQKDANTFFTFGYTNSPLDGTSDYDYFVLPTSSDNTTKNGLLIIPGPESTSDERLTSVMQAPIQSGGGLSLPATQRAMAHSKNFSWHRLSRTPLPRMQVIQAAIS